MYGWGHNHRGQLGGVEGNKIKTPRLCEAFSELSPVKVVGGEQTMFAITQDGKVPFFLLVFFPLHLISFSSRCMHRATGHMVGWESEVQKVSLHQL